MSLPVRVLNVGQCGPDHASISRMLTTQFSAEVDRADAWADTLAALQSKPYHLVLVNRHLDVDYSPGLDIIQSLVSHPEFGKIPVMLVSNYPDSQAEAVAAGAAHGFGKAELNRPTTWDRLRPYLSAAPVANPTAG